MPERVANNFSTTLNGAITNVATTIVTNAAAPSALQNGEFSVIVDSEIMRVTAGQDGTSWTVERQSEGTSAAAHSSAATVRHILTARALRVLKEELWMTDPRIDIQMNRDGVDQGPKIQQWLDLALSSTDAHAVARIPPGVVENRSVPDLYYSRSDKELIIEGCGGATNELTGSIIRFPVDFGTGFYAIKPQEGGSYPIHWRDFTLLGPGGGAAYGADQAAMFGPRIAGASKLSRVTISRFKTGAFCPGDHHQFYDCNLGGNSYNLYLADGDAWGTGDFWMDGCFLLGATKASIGIGQTCMLSNFTFRHGHAGFSPLGIHRFAEPGAAVNRETFMLGGVFDNFPFEACGDAVIYDEKGDGAMEDVEFAYQGEAGAPFNWKPGVLGRWHVASLNKITIRGDVDPFIETGIDKPAFYASSQIKDFHVQTANFAAHTTYADSGHKLVTCPYMEKVFLGMAGAGGGQGLNSRIVNVTEDVTRYDALELISTGWARKARNAYPYLGQALHDAAANTSVNVVTNGIISDYVRGKLIDAVVFDDMLVVDPANPGKLKKTTSFSFDVVARGWATIGAGATGAVSVTNSQAA